MKTFVFLNEENKNRELKKELGWQIVKEVMLKKLV